MSKTETPINRDKEGMNNIGAFCPECDYHLKMGAHPHKGQQIICTRCKAQLEVISLRPLELDLVARVNRSTKPKKATNIVKVFCPECDGLIKLSSHIREGQQVLCNACQAELEVVNLNPLELDWAMPINLRNRRKKFNK